MQIRQSGFSGGLLDALFDARSDLKRYGVSLADCVNMVVTPSGSLQRRGGTTHLVSLPTRAGVRLIPFVFTAINNAASQNHVIVAAENSFRIYQLYPTFGLEQVVTTTYAAADIPQLKYAQTGDEIFITHRNYAPMILKRLGASNWTLTAAVVTRGITMPASITTTGIYAGDAANPAKMWAWAVTAVAAESAGGDESLARVGNPVSAAIYSTHPVTVGWAAVSGAASYNIYRGRNGYFGYIGHVPGGTLTFSDDGIAPVLSEPPPQERNPWGLGANYYPSVVALFQQRLLVANAWNDPVKVWGSQTGSLKNFDAGFPPRDDDSITFAIANKMYEEIRAIVAMKQLLIFTNAAEWIASGTQNGPLTPKDIDLRVQSFNGSGWLDPLIIDNTVLYAQEKGRQVREFLYDSNSENYGGADLSVYAKYLFNTGQIKAWCYQEYPNKIVWMVKTDGNVVGMTYDKQNEVIAWHKHDFSAEVIDIVCIPSDGKDIVYLLIDRPNGHTLESMTSQLDGIYTDITGYGAHSTTYTLTALIGYGTVQVYRRSPPEVGGQIDTLLVTTTAPSGAGVVTYPYQGSEITTYVGIPLTARVGLLNAMLPGSAEGRVILKNIRKVWWELATRYSVTLGEEGQTAATMTVPLPETTRNSDGVLDYEMHGYALNSTWNIDGRATLEYDQPGEITIISVVREVEIGGS